jgi:2-keto-3-deoxy-L-rhamnonate aldolase RhmA
MESAGQYESENPLKRTLREGLPVLGLTVTIPSPDVVLQAARLGFDFVWIEMEHSPITLETARNMVLTTQGLGIVPVIRVPANELWIAKRALDVGALGVVFPFVSTPELARQAVDACKYPPAGRRGSGPGLARLRWPAPEGYADFADRNVMVIVMIEQKQAVDSIDEICAVPGIDVVFIGPNDLSHSYGFRGRQTPEVQEAIGKVVAAARRRNLPVGRTAVGPAELPGFIQQGFQFFQAPSDLALLAIGAAPLIEASGKRPPQPGTRPLY